MTPEQALNTLHESCEENINCNGRSRDALRQCTQQVAAFIAHARKTEARLKELEAEAPKPNSDGEPPEEIPGNPTRQTFEALANGKR